MDIFLIDRKSLGELVDAIIGNRFPGQPTNSTAFSDLREYMIRMLNGQLTQNIFAALPEASQQQFEQLVDQDVSDPAQYQALFEAANIDFDQIITSTVDNFTADFDKLLEENHHE